MISKKLGPAYEWRYNFQKPPKGGFLVGKHIYTFHTEARGPQRPAKKYNVEVHQYEQSIYILKFFLAAHKNSKHKFNLLANGGFRDARRVLDTCLRIMQDILLRDPLASGGFVGASKPIKDRGQRVKAQNGRTDKVSIDQTLEPESKNQRYRVYSLLVRNYFSGERWDHYYYDEESIYLLVNHRNPNSELHEVAWELYNNLKDIPQGERGPFPLRVVRRYLLP